MCTRLGQQIRRHAFDIYMRLSDEDKKDISKIRAELLKAFGCRQIDREEALYELSHCTV